MDNRYLTIMEDCAPIFSYTVENVVRDEMNNIGTAEQVTACVAAPALYVFVWWVLKNAAEQEIKDLYFLARDGYILLKIAEIIRDNCRLDIRLHYLYCSRMALRKASYSLPEVNFEEYIFEGGYKITPEVLFARAGLTEEQTEKLLNATHKDKPYLERQLSKIELRQLQKQLMEIPMFQQYCMVGSKEQLHACQEYFRQEGLLAAKKAGIVDTGWTGSVQKGLSQILKAAGSGCRLTGFYYGLYNDPQSGSFGEYRAWYFDGGSPLAKTARFNNNLLECFCAHHDPMTTGYEIKEGQVLPVFAGSNPIEGCWDIQRQHDIILAVATRLARKLPFEDFDEERYRMLSQRLLEQFMYHPTAQEAEAYGKFPFCDDMTEKHLVPLAVTMGQEEIRQYWVPLRGIQTCIKARKTSGEPVYWPAGAVLLSGIKNLRRWKRQFLIWDMLHIWKRRRG